MLHYWATDFYAPILSMGVEDKGDLLMYAVSDSHSEQHNVKAKVGGQCLVTPFLWLFYNVIETKL